MFNYLRPLDAIKHHFRTGTAKLICSMVLIFSLSACGPISSYHHAALDTPSRHVDNGMKFLHINKIDAAVSEFSRATELDPEYALLLTQGWDWLTAEWEILKKVTSSLNWPLKQHVGMNRNPL